ncbi:MULTISPECIES: hypothetical protein [Paenibacillus]|uniref:Uncharacterized protein n=1 Tax=Paenibacillus odorifer TaxID=189426 RepID=A0ABX3HGJ2_9BACL|nr:hypothetical protein [Paenibacillus odorifer]OMD48511.1 hypothetical protein BSK51_21510 [Paenibacillus odorifer]
MHKLSEIRLYNDFPWAAPVVPDVSEPYFAKPIPWQFPDLLIELIGKMFTEIEEFFNSSDLPIEVAIYEIKEVFGRLEISSFSPYPEVSAIFRKYTELSKGYFE